MSASESGRANSTFRPAMHSDWPGNVWELNSAIERGVVFGSARRLQLGDLPETLMECALNGSSLPSGYR